MEGRKDYKSEIKQKGKERKCIKKIWGREKKVERSWDDREIRKKERKKERTRKG